MDLDDIVFVCHSTYEVEDQMYGELFRKIGDIVDKYISPRQVLITFYTDRSTKNEFFIDYCLEYYNDFVFIEDLNTLEKAYKDKKVVHIFMTTDGKYYLDYVKTPQGMLIRNAKHAEVVMIRPWK